MFARKGKVLRIRPGPLANFSGGAGYMPFIVFLSVPASLMFGLVSSIVLYFTGRMLSKKSEALEGTGTAVPLHSFVRYAWVHVVVCAILTTLCAGALFGMGLESVYGSKSRYAGVTLVLTAGPLAAAFLSMLVLVGLIIRRGPQGANLAVAAIVHVLLLLGCIPLLMAVSALTGANV